MCVTAKGVTACLSNNGQLALNQQASTSTSKGFSEGIFHLWNIGLVKTSGGLTARGVVQKNPRSHHMVETAPLAVHRTNFTQ